MPEDATSAYLAVTEERLNASLPAAWTWAQFKIIEIEESAKPEDEVTVYSTGDFKPNVHLAKSDFDKLILSAAAADGSVIVRRECKHCTEVWQDIYLKLNSAKYFPSAYDALLVTWPWDEEIEESSPKGFMTAYNIYSTMADAKAGSNAWKFCRGGHKNVGFPGDCAPVTESPTPTQTLQWNSLTLAGQEHVRFTVRKGQIQDGLRSWETSSWQHHPEHNCVEGASPSGDGKLSQQVNIDSCKIACMETADCEGVVFSGTSNLGDCWLRKGIIVADCVARPEYDTWVQAKVKYFALQHMVSKCVHPQGGSASPGNGVHLLYHDSCAGDAELFRSIPAKGNDADEGFFVLQHKSGKCIHTGGEDAVLLLWDGCSTSDPNLQFRIIDRNDGYFNLQHRSGRCVHPSSGSAEPRHNDGLVLQDGCEISNMLAVRILPNFDATIR